MISLLQSLGAAERVSLPSRDASVGEDRGELRQLALAAEISSSEPFALAKVWQELARGRYKSVDWFCTEARCYLVVRDLAGLSEDLRPLPPRDRELVERGVLGDSEKVVAIEQGVAASTIAARLFQAQRGLGLQPGAFRVPLLLAIAVHADKGLTRLREGRRAVLPPALGRLQVFSAWLPTLPTGLTPAQTQVLQLMLEGHSSAEIATTRETSPRTIANQLAGIFLKLGTSGRRSLVSELLRRTINAPHASASERHEERNAEAEHWRIVAAPSAPRPPRLMQPFLGGGTFSFA